MRLLGWALVQCDLCSYKKRWGNTKRCQECMETEERLHKQQEDAHLQARETGFRRRKICWMPWPQSPSLQNHVFSALPSPTLWYFYGSYLSFHYQYTNIHKQDELSNRHSSLTVMESGSPRANGTNSAPGEEPLPDLKNILLLPHMVRRGGEIKFSASLPRSLLIRVIISP